MKEEILYGDIIVQDGKNQKTLKEVVFKMSSKEYKGKKILKILNYKVVGHTNTAKGWSEAKQSEEKRNDITGAYE